MRKIENNSIHILIFQDKVVTHVGPSFGGHLLAQSPHFAVALASTTASSTAAARVASLAGSLNVSRSVCYKNSEYIAPRWHSTENAKSFHFFPNILSLPWSCVLFNESCPAPEQISTHCYLFPPQSKTIIFTTRICHLYVQFCFW